jgi:hypothetical protein
MSEVTDGVADVLFGVVLTTTHYETRRGQLEFCRGRLVGVRMGLHEQWRDEGLTVGVIILPEPPSPAAATARAVLRVYNGGALDSETDLGEVSVEAGSR